MTPKQRSAYDFILAFCKKRGFSPSYTEIAVATNTKSKSRVFQLIEALEAQGKITRVPNRQRTVWPVELQVEHRKAQAADICQNVLNSHDSGTITAREAIEQIRCIPALLRGQA